jgi:hypothetical protein
VPPGTSVFCWATPAQDLFQYYRLQGLECGSSPTSGAVFPQVSGLWAVDCAQIFFFTLGAYFRSWPVVWPVALLRFGAGLGLYFYRVVHGLGNMT